jgi:hypothetical protein
MSRGLVLLLITVLVLSSLVIVGCVFAQSIHKPSVPEFTVRFVNASYIVTTTNSYTGVDETELVSNNSIEIKIANQPFGYSDYQLYYNVRVKPHFGDGWTEVYPVRNRTSSHVSGSIFSYAEYINEHSILQSELSYTNIAFPVVPASYYSELDYDVEAHFKILSAIPGDSQLDFQVEALVGHDSQVWVIEHPLYPEIGGYFEKAVAYDETSGWSNTQTVTIGVSQTSSPEPTTTTSPTPLPSKEPQSTEQAVILGLAITVAVLAACIGLLIYFIKRK